MIVSILDSALPPQHGGPAPEQTRTPPERPIRISELIDRLLRIPEQYRAYTEDETAAADVHKVPADLLRELLDHGFPHRGTEAGGLRFDRLDLENTGLALRLPSSRYVAMRRWPRALAAASGQDRREYRITIAGKCPDQGHEGTCDFEIDPDVLAAIDDSPEPTIVNGVLKAGVTIPVHTVEYGPELRALFRCVEDLDFHLLPVPMPIDLGWTRETGLADCRVAAQLLVARAAERGLSVRQADGCVMLPPFPMRHYWIEVLADDSGWAVADPFWFQSLARWGVVEPGQFPIESSPAGLLWKLYESNPLITLPLVRHAGRPADCLFAVSPVRPPEQDRPDQGR